jgi:hypothetical protein
MFSREHIQTYRITIDLPKDEKVNVVERFIDKYPMSSLKLDSDLKNILITFNKTFSMVPTMVFTGDTANFTVRKDSLILEMEKKKEGAEKVESFVEDSLKKISNDFNFIVAGVLGLLNLESLRAEEYFRVSKPLDDGLKLDSLFNKSFWEKLAEYGETHVSGLQVEFKHALMGCDVPHEIVLRREKKEIWGIVSCAFDFRGPMDLSSAVKDRLEVVNALYTKLLENA